METPTQNTPSPQENAASQGNAIPEPAVSPPREQPPIGDSAAVGYLTVSTGTGNKAWPLADVRIEIYLPGEDGSLSLFRTQVSDESGIAESVPIPAPAQSESLSPGSPYLPYTTALVRVFRDGYYPEEAREVPIFAGVKSLQYFDLVPLAESGQYKAPTGELVIVSEHIPDGLN
ncbi:MAG: hypothetical protein IJ449_09555 [Clostridia bacterium]|nr:hypothetical protein [Clostridia bacterium]